MYLQIWFPICFLFGCNVCFYPWTTYLPSENPILCSCYINSYACVLSSLQFFAYVPILLRLFCLSFRRFKNFIFVHLCLFHFFSFDRIFPFVVETVVLWLYHSLIHRESTVNKYIYCMLSESWILFLLYLVVCNFTSFLLDSSIFYKYFIVICARNIYVGSFCYLILSPQI